MLGVMGHQYGGGPSEIYGPSLSNNLDTPKNITSEKATSKKTSLE